MPAPDGELPGLIPFMKARLAEDEAAALATDDDETARSWESFDIGGYPVIGAGVTDGWGVAVVGPPAPSEDQARYIARYDPSRALREVAAKRARLALFDAALTEMDRMLADDDADRADRARVIGRQEAARAAVKLDAAVYSDHPDYDERWRPS